MIVPSDIPWNILVSWWLTIRIRKSDSLLKSVFPAHNHQRTNWLPVQRGYGSGRTQSHLDGQVLRPPWGIKPIGFMWSEVGPDEICFWRSKAVSSSSSRTFAFCENVWDKYKYELQLNYMSEIDWDDHQVR